jgi:hypothetical protein
MYSREMERFFAVRLIRGKIRELIASLPDNENDTVLKVQAIDKAVRDLMNLTIHEAAKLYEQPALYWDNPHIFSGVQDWAEYAMNVADQRAGVAVTLSNSMHAT